jgi:hypothetical protein
MMQDEVFFREIANVEIRPRRERMRRRADQHHLIGMDLHALQLAEDRLVLDEADVHFTIEHLTRNLVEAAAIDADLDLRMRP